MTAGTEQGATRSSSLTRNTMLVGMATVASRLLGFVRDVMLAAALGAGPVAEAFLVAFRIPNLVRRVLGEGGLNAGVIPVEQSVRSAAGEDAARRFSGEALANVALGLLIFLALIEIAAPLVILVIAPGFGEQAEFATLFLRLSAPLIAGATLASLGTAFLASRGAFGVAAFAPVVVNCVLVFVLFNLDRIAGSDPRSGGAVLSGSMALGGLLQAVLVLPAVFRSAHAPLLVMPRWSPEFKRALLLGGPGLIVVASTQLAVLVALQVGSALPGAVAHLHYADRVAQLPLGFVASALGVVVLPELARMARQSTSAFANAVNRACELSVFFGLPAAVALVILAEPIVATLFERGAFTSADTQATAGALAAMAVGLPFAVMARVLSQAFFARERARPALLATGIGLVATFVAATVLSERFGLIGLASSISIGAIVEVACLATQLVLLGWWPPDTRLGSRLVRSGVATFVMAVGLVMALSPLQSTWNASAGRAPVLAALCVGGLVLYLTAALLLRAFDWRELLKRPASSETPLA